MSRNGALCAAAVVFVSFFASTDVFAAPGCQPPKAIAAGDFTVGQSTELVKLVRDMDGYPQNIRIPFARAGAGADMGGLPLGVFAASAIYTCMGLPAITRYAGDDRDLRLQPQAIMKLQGRKLVDWSEVSPACWEKVSKEVQACAAMFGD